MLLIYVKYKTSRLEYTWDFIFKIVYKVNYKLTDSIDEIKTYEGPKFAYASEKIENILWIWSSNLLFEESIENKITESNDNIWGYVLFPSVKKESLLPFDLPSAVFWLITRYEEYLANYKNLDEHKRYKYTCSWLFKNDLLNKPIVNIWLERFIKILKNYFPNLEIKSNANYNLISTIDIDNFFACKGKPIYKSVLNTFRFFLNGRIKISEKCIKFLFTHKDDPFDTYDEIIKINRDYGLKPLFFILTSEKTKYDRNLNPESTLFIEKTKSLLKNSIVGIHFSYYSHNKKSFTFEKKLLEKIITCNIFSNRFHYLRFNLPDSYQQIYDIGIREDYSMYYPDINSFRSGTCTPYYFFNLKTNRKTDLKIYPYNFMDKHLLHKIGSYESILNEIEKNIYAIKRFNGTFVLAWHNENFYNIKAGLNLKDWYKKILEIALK